MFNYSTLLSCLSVALTECNSFSGKLFGHLCHPGYLT